MKTLLLFFALLVLTGVQAQQLTYQKTLGETSPVYAARSVYYYNRIYTAFFEEPNQLVMQKSDVDGNVLVKKAYTSFTLNPQKIMFAEAYGGNFVISGAVTTSTPGNTLYMPFLFKFDTSALTITSALRYPQYGWSNIKVYGSKHFSDGNTVMVTTGSNDGSDVGGYLLMVDGGGNVVHSYTCQPDLGYTQMKDAAEISSSSMLLTAKCSSVSCIVKCLKHGNGLIGSGVKKISGDATGLHVTGGGRIFLYGPQQIFRIDSNMNIAGSPGGISFANPGKVVASGNKLYRFENTLLQIIDSNLNVISVVNYSAAIQNTNDPHVTASANKLYLSYSPNSGGSTLQLLKTDLNGDMGPCTSAANSSTTSVTFTSTSGNPNSLNDNSSPDNFPLFDIVVENSYTVVCVVTGLDQHSSGDPDFHLSGGEGIFQLKSLSAIERLDIYDLNGRLMLKQTPRGERAANIDLQSFPRGVYVGRARTADKKEYAFKLVN